MTDTPQTIIRAIEYVTDDTDVIDSATRIAERAVAALEASATVIIELDGVLGVPSSFFNVILSRVASALSIDDAMNRIDFHTLSKPQQLALERSRNAIRDSAA